MPRLIATILLVLAAATETNGFTSTSLSRSHPSASSTSQLSAVDEAAAAALSDYMAKAHGEKLNAIKQVEDKKNAEISALKSELESRKDSPAPEASRDDSNEIIALRKEIEQLKSSALATAPASAPLASSGGELEEKLASYQNFMAEYIVKAQNQKLLAVREAELKAEKKFQERLEKLLQAGGMPMPPAVEAEVVPEVAAEDSSFDARNREVAASAAAGKSRWGEMEVNKAREAVAAKGPAAIAAAIPVGTKSQSSFQSRNAQVAAAAAAGKSRWGDAEVNRLNNGVGAAPAADSKQEEKAKDITTVSLEERVNLGARLLA